MMQWLQIMFILMDSPRYGTAQRVYCQYIWLFKWCYEVLQKVFTCMQHVKIVNETVAKLLLTSCEYV